MYFRRFFSFILAGVVFLNCSSKPRAVTYSAQNFLDAVNRKVVAKPQNYEMPDYIIGVLRVLVSRVLFVMPSYWQVGSVYEMLLRYGFPYMSNIRAKDYLIELLKNNISDEERIMLQNSESLDEIRINLQHMVIAYEVFIRSIKNNLPVVICTWIDQNYQQFWNFGSDIEATNEPIYKLHRFSAGRRNLTLAYGVDLESLRPVRRFRMPPKPNLGLPVVELDSSKYAPDGSIRKRLRRHLKPEIARGFEKIDLDSLQPVPRNFKNKKGLQSSQNSADAAPRDETCSISSDESPAKM